MSSVNENSKMDDVYISNVEKKGQEGIDAKAFIVCLIKSVPFLIILALTGAFIGSGLNLITEYVKSNNLRYVSETKYYIDFAEGRLEAKDYYNAYTWNEEVIGSDEILGQAMNELEGYDREYIKSTITAEILSDVRYLTITIKAQDKELVSKIDKALEKTIVNLGQSKDGFDSIYKIKEAKIVKEKMDRFSIRAAALGAFIMLIVSVFCIVYKFMIGNIFYTKMDVVKATGLDVLGLMYNDKVDREGRQETILKAGFENIIRQIKTEEKIYLVDVKQNGHAVCLYEKIEKLLDKDIYNRIEICDENNLKFVNNVVVVIPFGVPCREVVEDSIYTMQQHQLTIKGAVLSECDRHWVELYYGCK